MVTWKISRPRSSSRRVWKKTVAKGCRRSTGGFHEEGGVGGPTEAAEQLGSIGLRPPFPRGAATFGLESAAAWPLSPTVGAAHKECNMIAGHLSLRVVDALPAELIRPPVLLSNRPTYRAASTNGEARNGKESMASTPDRPTRPPSATEPLLPLAGLTLAELEKRAILQSLQRFAGNRTKAARALGISVRTLQRKLRLWNSAKRSTGVGTITEATG
jgi:hypothetical protein